MCGTYNQVSPNMLPITTYYLNNFIYHKYHLSLSIEFGKTYGALHRSFLLRRNSHFSNKSYHLLQNSKVDSKICRILQGICHQHWNSICQIILAINQFYYYVYVKAVVRNISPITYLTYILATTRYHNSLIIMARQIQFFKRLIT